MTFILVHAVVLALGWVLPSQPMGDVYNVYEPWSAAAASGTAIVGIDSDWVYPHLALVPMLTAGTLAWLGNYTVGWGVVVAMSNAVGFAFLLGRGRSFARRRAAGVWLLLILSLGPVGLYRIDAVTVPLVVVALLIALRHPSVAGALLAAGAWTKIWPGVILAALIAARRRGLRMLLGASATTIIVVGGVAALGGSAHLDGFLSAQFGRGLQLESPAATPFVVLAMLGVPGYAVGFDSDIITFQVTGPGVHLVATVLTPILVLVVCAGLTVLGWRGRHAARPSRLVPLLLVVGVLALIVFNKVGSPQFYSWIIAPVVFWTVIDWRGAERIVRLVVLLLVLTQFVYPIGYDLVRVAHPVGVALLVLRNVVLVWLVVWATRALVDAVRQKHRVVFA